MSLPTGTVLGPYELVSLLGAGGMGEVYRARDTRLDRIVAIKVLRKTLTGDDSLRTRFEREARAISQLSHPNICALYDIGNQDGSEYLVMEYVEGETLADRIRRGPLAPSQVLRYGSQIAEALHQAHRAGIAHRDLKPGNVMITSSGAKLLDFGLAKFVEPAHVFSDDSAPETARPLTAEGTIVGTFQYMSPEQLHGGPVDHRSDIFSLGVVLYEMSCGQRPFPATSSASLIAAIVSGDPVPLRSLQPSVSPALERIILTALEKNPDERWQTAQDVGRQLRWLAESSQSTTSAPAVVAPQRRRLSVAAVLAAAAVVALLTFAATKTFFTPKSSQSRAAHLQLALPEGFSAVISPESPQFALSPDGRTLCFVGRQGGRASLFLRALDSLAVRRIEGTDNPFAPFWSPDGNWIGYSAGGRLWKIAVAGAALPQQLCDVGPAGAVGTWGGNTILFIDRPGGRTEIYRVADTGGPPAKVTTLKPDEWRHGWPTMLPDGRHFLYLASKKNSLDRQLLLVSLDGGEEKVVLRNVSQVSLLDDSHLAYVRDGKLLSQRWDSDSGTIQGEPALLADDVSYFYLSARAQFNAANGTIVYRTNTSTGRLSLADRNGTIRVIDDQGPFYDVSLSPDGKRAAATVTERATGMGDIWIYDLARGVKDRFSNDPGFELASLWAPDSRSILYSNAPGGELPHLVRRTLASGVTEDVLPSGPFQFAGSFTRDGSSLFYFAHDRKTQEDIFRLDVATKKSTPVVVTAFNEHDPQVSPDGSSLAFVSDASGTTEVYILQLNSGSGERIRISRNGGKNPKWRSDGLELCYLAADGSIVSVVPTHPSSWSDVHSTVALHAPPQTTSFAMSPDGASFLLLEDATGAGDDLLNVILQ